jgi:predicted DsbA family dithiol-disulfide isomerase
LTTAVEIEIWSDVACPWCYIGKVRLESALADYPGEVSVRWRAFQLDPGAVSTGSPLVESAAAKFGGAERARQIFARTTATATAADGLELRFDEAVAANTFHAHRLIWFAEQHGKQAEIVEALHAAHFTHGRDVGSRTVLAAIAAEHGLDAADFLHSDAGLANRRHRVRPATQRAPRPQEQGPGRDGCHRDHTRQQHERVYVAATGGAGAEGRSPMLGGVEACPGELGRPGHAHDRRAASPGETPGLRPVRVRRSGRRDQERTAHH